MQRYKLSLLYPSLSHSTIHTFLAHLFIPLFFFLLPKYNEEQSPSKSKVPWQLLTDFLQSLELDFIESFGNLYLNEDCMYVDMLNLEDRKNPLKVLGRWGVICCLYYIIKHAQGYSLKRDKFFFFFSLGDFNS